MYCLICAFRNRFVYTLPEFRPPCTDPDIHFFLYLGVYLLMVLTKKH